MKTSKLFFIAMICVVVSATSAVESKADLVWSDTFTQADASPFSDRLAEMVGTGFSADVDGTGTINIDANAIVIASDGGSDRIEFTSDAAALAGNFQFDITGDSSDVASTANVNHDRLFIQMVDGPNRSTGGTPLPHFSDSLDISVNGLDTTKTINYFFNASGADINYVGPDGSAQVLPSAGYDFWIGTTLTNVDQTSPNTNLPTGGVDTLVLQTFGAADGAVWTVDNASFNTIDVVTVPEPSSLAFVGIFLAGFCVRRRK